MLSWIEVFNFWYFDV
jgi:26S proteasome regulatory subunit N2